MWIYLTILATIHTLVLLSIAGALAKIVYIETWKARQGQASAQELDKRLQQLYKNMEKFKEAVAEGDEAWGH